MKKTKTLYWIFTALFAFVMAGSAIPNVMMDPLSVKGMHEGLGYPLYFIPFIGVAKLLGVVAILVPRFPRLKEFAYAGLLFDLVGAVYSLAAVGATFGDYLFMLLPLTLWVLSYTLYHRVKHLGGVAANGLAGSGVARPVL